MKKVLSIVIPAYQMEGYLTRTLTSLLLSDRDALDLLDVIVVNDGSKDRTSEIAHEFASKYPSVFRVVDKANGNYGSCINVALPLAAGKYVKMLDADDSYLSENMVDYVIFLRDSNADLVVNDFDYVNADGKVFGHKCFFLPRGVFRVEKLGAEFAKDVQMPSVAYRTEKLQAIGYRQTEGISYTDQEWMFLPMSTVEKVEYFPRVVYRYLLGREGQTTNYEAELRGRSMILKITKGLVDLFVKNQCFSTCPARGYMRTRLLRRLLLTYSMCVLETKPFEYPDEISQLDVFLEDNLPEIFTEVGAFVPLNGFHFRFVRTWRNHGREREGGVFYVYDFVRSMWRALKR